MSPTPVSLTVVALLPNSAILLFPQTEILSGNTPLLQINCEVGVFPLFIVLQCPQAGLQPQDSCALLLPGPLAALPACQFCIPTVQSPGAH